MQQIKKKFLNGLWKKINRKKNQEVDQDQVILVQIQVIPVTPVVQAVRIYPLKEKINRQSTETAKQDNKFHKKKKSNRSNNCI